MTIKEELEEPQDTHSSADEVGSTKEGKEINDHIKEVDIDIPDSNEIERLLEKYK